jgi:hypothetical protein
MIKSIKTKWNISDNTKNQCSALSDNNFRCVNECIGKSLHCQIHNDTAKHLYLNYKCLSEHIKTIDINKPFECEKDQYDYLRSYLKLLNNSFSERLKNRQYAFAPECYDEGHDYHFRFLQKKMHYCENKMKTIKKTNQNFLSYLSMNTRALSVDFFVVRKLDIFDKFKTDVKNSINTPIIMNQLDPINEQQEYEIINEQLNNEEKEQKLINEQFKNDPKKGQKKRQRKDSTKHQTEKQNSKKEKKMLKRIKSKKTKKT